MTRGDRSEEFYSWIAKFLPHKLIIHCALNLLAKTTSGRYKRTSVVDLSAMEAINRYSRLYGMGGSGADEFYDSNRFRYPLEIKDSSLESQVESIWGQSIHLWDADTAGLDYQDSHKRDKGYDTVQLIRKNITMALISPSSYVRTMAELISKDLND